MYECNSSPLTNTCVSALSCIARQRRFVCCYMVSMWKSGMWRSWKNKGLMLLVIWIRIKVFKNVSVWSNKVLRLNKVGFERLSKSKYHAKILSRWERIWDYLVITISIYVTFVRNTCSCGPVIRIGPRNVPFENALEKSIKTTSKKQSHQMVRKLSCTPPTLER